MSSKKYFYGMVALLILLILAIIGSTVAGNMLLEKQSKKLSELKVENESIELQQNALIQAKKDVEKYNEIDQIAKSVVPRDKDQAKTVREIVQIANASGVPIKSVTFPTSTLGQAAPTPAPAPAGEGGAASTPQAAPKPTDGQVKAVSGLAGVYVMEIKVESNGKVSYQNFLKFLDALEKNRRTAHVNGIKLDPSDNGRNLSFNLTLNAYLKP